jgi:hypothetical protein
MTTACGKAVGKVWIEQAVPISLNSSNRFEIHPQLFHRLSTEPPRLSTHWNGILSTFPQHLLLQLYILTNPYYLDGEF